MMRQAVPFTDAERLLESAAVDQVSRERLEGRDAWAQAMHIKGNGRHRNLSQRA
jgi:hypothetical protein